MKQLKNCVAPVQILALLAIPFVITLMLITLFASGLSLLNLCSFREATHNGVMMIIGTGIYFVTMISTGAMMWENE